MQHEGISWAVSALGVEAVQVLSAALGGRWAAAVLPFTRVRQGTSEVDVVLPSAIDLEGVDHSASMRAVMAHGTEARHRMSQLATAIAVQLDGAGVAWDWGAVRLRRTPDGGMRAALELGDGLPPMRPLELLGGNSILPPPAAAQPPARPWFLPPPPRLPEVLPAGPGRARMTSMMVPSYDALPPPPPPPSVPAPPESEPPPSSIPPAPESNFFDSLDEMTTPQADDPGFASPLGQPELSKTMNRAQQLVGLEHAAFASSVARCTGTAIAVRERAVDFSFAKDAPRRFACDCIATYHPAESRWQWGWAIEAWHPAVRQQSEKLRVTGANWSLRALSMPELYVQPEPAARLALMSAWILGGGAYYFSRSPQTGVETVLAIYGVG